MTLIQSSSGPAPRIEPNPQNDTPRAPAASKASQAEATQAAPRLQDDASQAQAAAQAKRLNDLQDMFSDLNLSAIRGSEATALASALYEAGEISREQKDIMQITALIASDVEDAPINLPQELNAIANQPNLPSFRNADDLATLLLDLYEEVKPNEAGRAEPSTVEVSSNQAQPTPERLDIRA